MITLKYALVIEDTADPSFFGFCAPDLPGFTGVGTSIEDCVEKARAGMEEHVSLLLEQGLTVPSPTADPSITVYNQRGLADAATRRGSPT